MTPREMSRDTKYMISVMQAYEDGKEIEFRCRKDDAWSACPIPTWNWQHWDYRVKPEPKYVPYDSVEEVEKDKWFKNKFNDILSRIMGLDANDSDSSVRLVSGWCSLKDLFEYYTYEDGTPCGKKVEE